MVPALIVMLKEKANDLAAQPKEDKEINGQILNTML